ncbi:MAG: hypothetical protein R3F54_18100 [Alphaproteobacteria bacterium]
MIRGLSFFMIALAPMLLLDRPAAAAENPLEGDLRDLSVGESVEQLSSDHYVHFACGNDGGEPGEAIDGWADYAQCPANRDGLHEVAFSYAEDNPWAAVSDKWEGTKVAGHPVQPSLLITDDGMVKGIRIVTNGKPLYLKKKAFLLPIRIMGRYGRDGWTCEEHEPGGGKTAIGGMFIDRLCEKTFHDRRLIMKVDLYRTAEQHGQDFTGSTRFEIYKADAG